jgi:hypothetical protein
MATLNATGRFIERQPITVSFTNPQDPSMTDTAAGFLYSFDLDGDGVFEIVDSKNPSATFIPPTQGNYTFRGIIKDKDGGSTEYVANGSTVAIGNVDRFGVAPGNGGAPRVQVYDTNGVTKIADFFAYEVEFRGGVQIAVGDVTGDGIPDIVTGTGIGGGPVVRVFDGVTFGLISSFFAYEETFRGGVQVAVGDMDGDGIDEIITGVGDGGGPVVKVFQLNGTLLKSFAAYEISFRGGVNVAAGDLDGDGKDEIITGAGNTGGPVVKAFKYPALTLFTSFLAYEETFRGGVNVAAGDVDGDGQVEIVTGTGFTGGTRLRSFDGKTAAPELSVPAFGLDRVTQQPLRNGFHVTTRDIDGDGIDDILAASGPDFTPQVNVFLSSTPPTGPALDEFFVPFELDFIGGVYIG